MSLRKAAAYSKRKARPYTRKSRNKSKSYIKVVPPNKIVKYNMGNIRAFNEGKFLFVVRCISNENIQIRDTALEAARMLINKVLEEKMPGKFYLGVKVYPHHILRNNKTAAGAGADRLSSGMKHSFGVVEGRAAFVKNGQDVFYVACDNENDVRTARDAMLAVRAKIPCKSRILIEKKEE